MAGRGGGGGEAAERAPLLPGGAAAAAAGAAPGVPPGSAFWYGSREPVDVAFWWAFKGAALVVAGGGAFAAAQVGLRGRGVFPWTDAGSPAACGLSGLGSLGSAPGGGGARTLRSDNGEGGSADKVLLVSLAFLALGLAGAVALGVLKLRIVRSCPRQVVWLMVIANSVLPMGMGAALAGASAAGADGLFVPGLCLVALGAFGGLIVCLWRRRIAKAADLLAVTAHSVNENRSVFTASFLFQACSVAVVLVVVLLACLSLAADTKLVRSPDLLPGADGVQGDHCVGHPIVCDDGECYEDLSQVTTVPCCVASIGGFGIAYTAGSFLFLLWATSLMYALKQFTISGTVAQWYFSPVGSSTSGNLMRSLRHGLGPQIGTLACAAAIKNALDLLRGLVNSAQPRGGGCNILTAVYFVFQGLVALIAEVLETVTEYAVVYAAVSGMALRGSGRVVADMGKRYFGDAVAMWAFPETMLGTLVLYLALVWTTLMGVGTWLLLLGDPQGQSATVAVSAGVFSITLLILSFFSGVVLDAVKAVFVCYCLDKDRHQISRWDMHEAFGAVPLGKAGKGAAEAATP